MWFQNYIQMEIYVCTCSFLASFTQHNIFKIHVSCYMYHQFGAFYCRKYYWETYYWYISFGYPLDCWLDAHWTSDCLQFLMIIIKAAINIFVQGSLQTYGFMSFVQIPMSAGKNSGKMTEYRGPRISSRGKVGQ